MVLDSLNNYIGLTTAGTDSGLALMGLPGISFKNFQGIKNSSTDDDTALWNSIQARTLLKLLTASTASFNRCYKINDTTVIGCLVVENKQLFATTLWYMLGAETMQQRLYSDAVNRWTSIDRDEAGQLLNYYTVQFENELEFAVNGVSPNDSDCTNDCVECGGSIRWVEGLI